MDSLTQAALGAAVGEAVLGKKLGYKASLTGAIIGTIPDLDVLLLPFFDELQKVSLHRGYSHSILACFLGAFLIAYILNRIQWTNTASFTKLWFLSLLVLMTHILLDAFTSFGTQLFLPFTDWRVSFDSIGIIDPVYTLPLLIGLLVSLVKFDRTNPGRVIPNYLGLMISSLYLIFTLANKQHIETVFNQQLEEQNMPSFRLLTVPVSIGNMVWYGVAKDQSNLYIGKYSLLKKNNIQFDTFSVNDHLLEGLDAKLIDRMKWFAQGFYSVAEKDGKIRIYNMQCDMQGVRQYGDYRAPTAFYYEITPKADGTYLLRTGMHKANKTN